MQVSDFVPDGWQVMPNGLVLKFVAPTVIEARSFAKGAKNGLSQLAKRLGTPVQIVSNGESIAEFGKPLTAATEAQSMSNPINAIPDEHQNLLWFAQISIDPTLLRIANDLMQERSATGVVRLSDELQVVMNDGAAVVNPGHTFVEATNWTRDRYYHPTDLDGLRQLTRQQNEFELTWRSFDPDLGMYDRTPGNWLEFTHRYRLIEGEIDAYHLWRNMNIREIAPVF
jgi:hypothetical protein